MLKKASICLFYFFLFSLHESAFAAPFQKRPPSDFLINLKKATAAVILSDGSKATPEVALIGRKWKDDKCQLSVRNVSQQPIRIREVIVFDLEHGLPGNTPIYGESFQMLAQIGGTLANPEDLGTYTDRKHYKIPEPENMRTAYGLLTLAPAGAERLLLATTSCNKFISRFSFDVKRLRISIDCESLVLSPGQSWNLEEFLAVSGPDREKLYDQLTAAIAVHHPKLKHEPVPTGWCSWYCFGPRVTAQNVRDNTKWIAENLPALKYIQLDDGYQPWMGDWLDGGKAFDGDVKGVLKEIKAKGLEPAIWVAPFIASPQSRLFKEHPDWMVKDESGQPMPSDKVGFGGWRQGPWYVLDGTHPEVQKFLTALFKTLREQWGCSYFKLDANYWGAIHGGVHYDKNATRIEAYRRGMEAIRKGAGDAFLLGCNHPIWASLGLIHGSRSSMDISRKWTKFKTIGKENLLRGWQNGRFWWNDPDCILLTGGGSKEVMDQGGNLSNTNNAGLSENEFRFHAVTIFASGGMLLSGDDLTTIAPERLAMLKKLIPPMGMTARFENDAFEVGITNFEGIKTYSVFNWGDSVADRTIVLPPGRFRLKDKLTGKLIGEFQKAYTIQSMAIHSAMLVEAMRMK